jgi:hypothetical protein
MLIISPCPCGLSPGAGASTFEAAVRCSSLRFPLRQISLVALTGSDWRGYSGIAVPKYQFSAGSCGSAMRIQ